MKDIGFARQSIHRFSQRLGRFWDIPRRKKRIDPKVRTDPPDRPEPDNRLTLRVMSFNIRRGTARDGRNQWPFRRSLVHEVLNRHRPDVLGLQEALDFQLSEVRIMLPGYDAVGCGHLGGSQGLHNAILYDARRFALSEEGTFWLSDTPDRPGSKGWGNILPRTCTWARLVARDTGQAFYFYNTHLDHLSLRSRKRSVVFLTQRIQTRPFADPFVLTGDFNAREQSAPIRYLKGKARLDTQTQGKRTNPDPLVDTFRAQYPNRRPPATFHGFRRFLFHLRLDYIFVPPGVGVRDTAIIQMRHKRCYPSDHFPLLTRVDLPIERTFRPRYPLNVTDRR